MHNGQKNGQMKKTCKREDGRMHHAHEKEGLTRTLRDAAGFYGFQSLEEANTHLYDPRIDRTRV